MNREACVLAGLTFEPWFRGEVVIVSVLVTLAATALLVRAVTSRGPAMGRHPWQQRAILALSLLALILLGGATLGLNFRRASGSTGMHLVVVLDTSDSVSRDPAAWMQELARIRDLLVRLIASLPAERCDQSVGSLMLFNEKPVVVEEAVPLRGLPEVLGRMPASWIGGGATDLEAALNQAGRMLRPGGRAGVILLVSDGNETRGKARAALASLTSAGIVVHVAPLEGRGPILFIADMFLPRRVRAGEAARVRALFKNSMGAPVPSRWQVACGVLREHLGAAAPEVLEPWNAHEMAKGELASVRREVRFSGHGLQYAEARLAAANQAPHLRRRFTYVEKPPAVLSVGGDHQWGQALAPTDWKVTQVAPGEVAAELDRESYDAVVIGGLTAVQLGEANLARLAAAVRAQRLGLFLFNGGHDGVPDETESVLTTYQKTALEPLLPVQVDPRAYKPVPPPRQVVIVLDRSGSMANLLGTAKAICGELIGQMRDQDRLDLVTFSDNTEHRVVNQLMTPAGKEEALRQVRDVPVGGGTVPALALAFLRARTLTKAGFFFISDGEFPPSELSAMSPFASTNAFAMGQGVVSPDSPLRLLSDDPIPVGPTFDPRALRLRFFEPEERKKYFERGAYVPVRVPDLPPGTQGLQVPGLDLEGNAVCYAKPTNSLILAVRPKLADPVLAFGQDGVERRVGVFTTRLPPAWCTASSGREAVQSWLRRVLPLADRDRYDFEVEERGDQWLLRVTLLARQGRVPRVSGLQTSLEISGATVTGVALAEDLTNPGSFRGTMSVPRGTQPTAAHLVLTEAGEDALPTPQRVPLMIPPALPPGPVVSDEAWVQGVNRRLLEELATETGGRLCDDTPGLSLGQLHPMPPLRLWPVLAVAAAVCYLMAVALRRW